MMMQIEKCYFGIDVSKGFLDVYVLSLKQPMQFKNDAKGIRKFIQKLKSFSNAHIVMEATGGYEKNLAHTLTKSGFPVAIVNPRQIRNFAKALGMLAKTDRLDAQTIALFAEKIQPPVNVTGDENQQKLAETNARRRQLIDMITQEKNRLDKVTPELQKSIKRILKVLEKELDAINELLKKAVESNASYAQKNQLLKSIKGVGFVSSAAMIADLPELGCVSAKKITALAGLAPYNRDSGTLRGKRCIWGGRGSVRKTLYMAALVATKHNVQIKIFYERLCRAGKNKKIAIIACMRKLLIIMNAILKSGQPWQTATAF